MLNYQIALTNAIFDDTYRNVLRFDTRAEQEAYFNVNTLFANNPELKCNFHVGTLYATSVVVDVNTDDLNEALNYNYCIVKDMTPGAVLKYYYYFVKKAQQDNATRLICDLELDVYQTYYIDLNFGDCAIVRAHLNRFIENEDNTVSFDANPNSKLFEREEVQDVPKRLVKRTRINKTGNGNYYDSNVLCWLYLYLDPTHEFDFYTPNGTIKKIKPDRIKIETIPTNIGCLAIPIYAYGVEEFTDKRIKLRDHDYGNSGYEIKLGGLEFLKDFETLNNGYSYIYSAKLSLMPPGFDMNVVQEIIQEASALNNWVGNDYPNIPGNSYYGEFAVGKVVSCKSGTDSGALLLSALPEKTYEFVEVTITDKQLTFNKNEIVGADANVKFNPKLLNNDYYEINLVDTSGSNFKYDLQKFGTNKSKLLISEPLTPDFTKNYARLKPPVDNTLYVQATTQNLLGLVTSNDNTILLPTSAYQSMIAQNKNFYQQASFNRDLNLYKGAASVGANLATGNWGGAIASTVNTGLDYYQSVQNQKYEIDNLRNAPGSITAASGNFIFNTLYNRPGFYIEEYDITDNSKKAINDFIMLYGFSYNRIDNIKNVDNIRKNYNYVKAYVEEINTGLVNISNVVHNKIREIFAYGIRMWNLREFTYEKENYERWLEE